MIKFETGKTYWTRSACDYDCIIELTVHSRTEKTLRTHVQGKDKTLRIREYDGAEMVSPWGRYSMSPVISADKQA